MVFNKGVALAGGCGLLAYFLLLEAGRRASYIYSTDSTYLRMSFFLILLLFFLLLFLRGRSKGYFKKVAGPRRFLYGRIALAVFFISGGGQLVKRLAFRLRSKTVPRCSCQFAISSDEC